MRVKHFYKFLSLIKIIFVLSFSVFFINCAGTLEQDLKKLDEIYGYCDNPQRNLRGSKYETCKAKERAAGPEGKADEKTAMSFDTIVEKIRGGPKQNVFSAPVNPSLWRGSLEALKPYDLKIADNQGGFIQTEWIYNSNEPNSRCIIKIQINSIELVSNGVDAVIQCQKKLGDIWQNDDIQYITEEKKLILKILELANNHSSENS